MLDLYFAAERARDLVAVRAAELCSPSPPDGVLPGAQPLRTDRRGNHPPGQARAHSTTGQ